MRDALAKWYSSRLGIAIGLLIGLVAPSFAVMPPHAEARAAVRRIEAAEKSRTQAQDIVQLKIIRLDISEKDFPGCPSLQRWDMEAQVVNVTEGKLKAGETIRLSYVWERYECPGPVRERIPILSAGMETAAYLNCQPEGLCVPAASEMSYMSSDEFAKELQKRRGYLQSLQPR